MEGRGFVCPSCGKHWVLRVAVFPGLRVSPGLGGSLFLTGVRVLGGTSDSFFLQLWKCHSMTCLTPYFSPQNCSVQYRHTLSSVCLGMAIPANAWELPLAESSWKSLGRSHRSVYRVFTDCPTKRCRPNCMAWIHWRCSGLAFGSALGPETSFGPKT